MKLGQTEFITDDNFIFLYTAEDHFSFASEYFQIGDSVFLTGNTFINIVMGRPETRYLL